MAKACSLGPFEVTANQKALEMLRTKEYRMGRAGFLSGVMFGVYTGGGQDARLSFVLTDLIFAMGFLFLGKHRRFSTYELKYAKVIWANSIGTDSSGERTATCRNME